MEKYLAQWNKWLLSVPKRLRQYVATAFVLKCDIRWHEDP